MAQREYQLSMAEMVAFEHVIEEGMRSERRFAALAAEVERTHGMPEGVLSNRKALLNTDTGKVTVMENEEGGKERGNVESE